MRDLDPAFAAHIAGAATTLARCWRVTRRDEQIIGFIDHDRDLAIRHGRRQRDVHGPHARELRVRSGLRVDGRRHQVFSMCTVTESSVTVPEIALVIRRRNVPAAIAALEKLVTESPVVVFVVT